MTIVNLMRKQVIDQLLDQAVHNYIFEKFVSFGLNFTSDENPMQVPLGFS